jgi:monoamine oxidase
MGHTAKIGMLFAPDYSFDVPQDNTFVMPFAHGNEAPLVQTRAFGHKNFAIVIIGGQQVVDLEVRGQLVPYALDQLVGMFGSRTRDAFRKGVASSWNTDPLTLGGYSYAPPGAVPFRAQLAQPLAKQVFFAGEAVSIGSHSAAHGAFISGHYAAKKAIEAIG